MKKVFIIVCSLVTVGASAQMKDSAQAVIVLPASDTNVHVIVPSVVQSTEQKLYQYQRFNHGTMPGYRVQIDFGQEKDAVDKTQADFTGKYPGIPTYVSYVQPYFKLNVGDFRTKLQATDFLNHVRKDYRGAFIVADKIVPPPL